MKRTLIALAIWLASPALALAAYGTIYVDTAGTNGALATNSGTTDTTTPTFTGATVDSTNAAGTTMTLPTNTDLTGLVTDGSQAIYWNNATNSNQKIFWISGVTGCTGSGACSLTTTATTCTAGTSAGQCGGSGIWSIGGRYLWPSGSTQPLVVNALTGRCDTLQFNNTPAARTAAYLGAGGGSAAGCTINVIGKAGQDHPYLHTTSGNNNILSDGGNAGWWFENLQLQGDGNTSAAIVNRTGSSGTNKNLKITGTAAGTANCITISGASTSVIDSEITGCAADGINSAVAQVFFMGNYIHDNGGDGIEITSTAAVGFVTDNIFDTNGGKGLYFSGATFSSLVLVEGNTFYANTGPNIEVTAAGSRVVLRNNISSNASANTVKWDAGNAETATFHDHNTFFGAGGTSGLTLNSTETSSDPLLSNPAGGAFVIPSSSPAAGTGYPGTILGTSIGYRDMGAVQHQGGGSVGIIGQ